MDRLGPFITRGFQYFSYNQGCACSIATLHQLDRCDHQFKWNVGDRVFHRIELFEGAQILVQLYVWEAQCSFQAACFALSPKHNFRASLWAGFIPWTSSCSGPWFNIKTSSYQYRKSHCGDETILRPCYLHNGISYTGKTTSLYWIGAQVSFGWRGVIGRSCWMKSLLFCLGFCQMNYVLRPLGFLTLLPPFFQIFLQFYFPLSALSTATFRHQVSFHHRWFLVNLHMLSAASRRLEFSFPRSLLLQCS